MSGRRNRLQRLRQESAIPGFGLALGYSLAWLSLHGKGALAILVPRALEVGASEHGPIIRGARTPAALRVSFGLSFLAAVVNGIAGLALAWVLVRYRFPGRRLLDAIVDLPFALPTAVAGIALTALFAPNGWFGALLAPLGIPVAYTILGIMVAMCFTSLPFVVRSVQPVLEDLDSALEEAAQTLGARDRAIFREVILPLLTPALLAGVSLAFARSL